MNKKLSGGFTLFEMIISVAILGVLITSVLSLNINARQVSTSVIVQSSMQEELRTAAALIADEVQRAYYVFPPCGAYTTSSATTYNCGTRFNSTDYNTSALNVSFSKFDLKGTSGLTKLRPDKLSTDPDARVWTVSGVANNDAPILAMIVAPQESGPNWQCSNTDDKVYTKACYYFVAYYPVKRSSVTRVAGDTASQSKEKLEPLADNENQWVLMEYRQILRGTGNNLAAVTNQTVPGLASTITIPATNWADVGCSAATYACDFPSNPAPTPDPSIIRLDGQLPAVYRGVLDPTTRAMFTGKMDETVKKFGDANTSGNIIATNINPRGFQIAFPAGSIDERGVSEVQIKLQGGIVQGTQTTTFPKEPIEIYASPRNITPAFLGR